MSPFKKGETLVSLKEASAHLPKRHGKKVHYSARRSTSYRLAEPENIVE